jgi:hypothetical protein
MKPLPLDDIIGIWNGFNEAFLVWTGGPEKQAEFVEKLKEACRFMRKMCEYIGASDDLLYQIDQVGRWADADIDRQALFMLAVSMLGSVTHALGRPQFKVIPTEKLRFFDQPRKEFGDAVVTRFGPIEFDVEEAGKCYAAGRDTASVFHLMRIMEVGLRALGASLNDPRLDPKRNPSWDAILQKCSEELDKPLKDRSVEWRQDEEFYSYATANLRAVKNAWRNPTIHVERRYEPDEAEDVWNAVRAFMRHLSQKLTV